MPRLYDLLLALLLRALLFPLLPRLLPVAVTTTGSAGRLDLHAAFPRDGGRLRAIRDDEALDALGHDKGEEAQPRPAIAHGHELVVDVGDHVDLLACLDDPHALQRRAVCRPVVHGLAIHPVKSDLIVVERLLGDWIGESV